MQINVQLSLKLIMHSEIYMKKTLKMKLYHLYVSHVKNLATSIYSEIYIYISLISMYIKYMALMPICGLFWTPCSLHEEYLMNFSPLAVLLHASNIYYTFPLAAVRIFVFRNYLNICDIHVLHPFVVKFWSITSEMMLQNFTINGWINYYWCGIHCKYLSAIT